MVKFPDKDKDRHNACDGRQADAERRRAKRRHANKVASKKTRERKNALLAKLETTNKTLLAEANWLRSCLKRASLNATIDLTLVDFYQQRVQDLQEQIELQHFKHRQANPHMDTSANFILGMAGNEMKQLE